MERGRVDEVCVVDDECVSVEGLSTGEACEFIIRAGRRAVYEDRGSVVQFTLIESNPTQIRVRDLTDCSLFLERKPVRGATH